MMDDDLTRTFDLDRFVDDLRALVGYQTIVCRNPDAFARARDGIRQYLASTDAEFLDFDVDGTTSMIVRPRGSQRPTRIGDANLEVFPPPTRGSTCAATAPGSTGAAPPT